MFINSSIKNYLNKLSSEEPVPGGGGTSALVAALGISLAIMVAKISLKSLNKKQQKGLNKGIKLLEHLRRNAEQIVDLDPKVYKEVIASYKRLKRLGKTEKAQAGVKNALQNSFRLQADLALLIAMAKQLLPTVDAFAEGSIQNDLIVSSGLLDGAFKGALATARINVVYLKQGKQRRHCEQALAKVEQKYGKLHFE